MSTPIKVNNVTVGVVEGPIFHKRISGRRHFLRRPPAIAFDTASLADAVKAGARTASITDTDTGIVYRASIDSIYRHGLHLDRGYGPQIALAIGRWSTHHPEQPSLFGTEEGLT